MTLSRYTLHKFQSQLHQSCVHTSRKSPGCVEIDAEFCAAENACCFNGTFTQILSSTNTSTESSFAQVKLNLGAFAT